MRIQTETEMRRASECNKETRRRERKKDNEPLPRLILGTGEFNTTLKDKKEFPKLGLCMSFHTLDIA